MCGLSMPSVKIPLGSDFLFRLSGYQRLVGPEDALGPAYID